MLLTGLEVFLMVYFDLRYLFYDTVITGGDTASWQGVADHLLNVLLPRWRLTGWDMGNFCGYPNFSFYFLPPFLLAVLPAALIGLPLTITLKWAIMSGIFLLPLTTYAGLKTMGHRFPIPIIGSAGSLLLIFNEWYTMFGGNALSTFAGEFCYMFALAVFAYFIGSFYRGMVTRTRVISNGLLLGLIGLSHLFVFIPALILMIYAFFQKKRIGFVLKVGGIAFAAMAFWILPLVAFRDPYTTPVYMIWEKFTHLNYTGAGLLIFVFLAGPGISLLAIKKTRNNECRWWRAFVLFSGMSVMTIVYLTGRYLVLGHQIWQTGLPIPHAALSPLESVDTEYLIRWILPGALAAGMAVSLIGGMAHRRGKNDFISFCRTMGSVWFFGSVAALCISFHLLIVREMPNMDLRKHLLNGWMVTAIYAPPAVLLWYGLFFSQGFGRVLVQASRRVVAKRLEMWLFLIFGCVTVYFGAHFLQVPDIRFLPPILFALVIIYTTEIPGVFVAHGTTVVRAGMAITVCYLIMVTVIFGTKKSGDWYRYNNKGYAHTYGHSDFTEMNQYLGSTYDGSVPNPLNAPRVGYEKSNLYAPYGGDRAFESLPFFSGRQTMEGIHYAGSIASRSIAFLQSEYSMNIKTPAPLILSKINTGVLPVHLDLYNISHLVVASDTMKKALSIAPLFEKEATFGTLTLFRFTGYSCGYVDIPKIQPQLYKGPDWPTAFFTWFKNYNGTTGLLVADRFVKDDMDRATLSGAPDTISAPGKGTENDSDQSLSRISTHLEHLKIQFTTNKIGRPHLIKVSYFPNWRVKGANGIYPVSPHFMMVIPREREVILTYERSFWEVLGCWIGAVCLTGCIIGLSANIIRRRTGVYENRKLSVFRNIETGLERIRHKSMDWIRGVFIICCAGVIIGGITLRNRPVRIFIKGQAEYDRGIEALDRQQDPNSRRHFKKAIDRMAPLINDRAGRDHLDIINAILLTAKCYENLDQRRKADAWYQTVLEEYPYSRYVGEAHVMIARNFGRRAESLEKKVKRPIKNEDTPTPAHLMLMQADDIKEVLNLWEHGINHYKMALQKDPYSLWADRAEQELKNIRFVKNLPAWEPTFQSHPEIIDRVASLRKQVRAILNALSAEAVK